MAAINRLKDPPTWLKVATTQEIDLQPWAPRQWTSTTTHWRCGHILLPSLILPFQITSVSIVCSTSYAGADRRNHQSSRLLAFVRGIYQWPLNSPHKRPVMWKMFPFDDVNMWSLRCSWSIACRRCSNYIFILNLTPGFNGLAKGNCRTRRQSLKFLDLVQLI